MDISENNKTPNNNNRQHMKKGGQRENRKTWATSILLRFPKWSLSKRAFWLQISFNPCPVNTSENMWPLGVHRKACVCRWWLLIAEEEEGNKRDCSNIILSPSHYKMQILSTQQLLAKTTGWATLVIDYPLNLPICFLLEWGSCERSLMNQGWLHRNWSDPKASCCECLSSFPNILIAARQD